MLYFIDSTALEFRSTLIQAHFVAESVFIYAGISFMFSLMCQGNSHLMKHLILFVLDKVIISLELASHLEAETREQFSIFPKTRWPIIFT